MDIQGEAGLDAVVGLLAADLNPSGSAGLGAEAVAGVVQLETERALIAERGEVLETEGEVAGILNGNVGLVGEVGFDLDDG